MMLMNFKQASRKLLLIHVSTPKTCYSHPMFLHSDGIYALQFKIKSAENLLPVPMHAKQNAGTPSAGTPSHHKQKQYWQPLHFEMLLELLRMKQQ